VQDLMTRWPRSLLLIVALTPGVTPGVAHAQARVDCSRRISPGVGFSAGRSLTPYVELSPELVDGRPGASILTRGGVYLAGRLDLPIAGPWRGRVEVSGANWRLEQNRYGDDLQLVATDPIGQIEAREIVALVGRQGGRAPCGYVLAGGGLYSLDLGRMRVRRTGVALTGGIELPIRGRGALQLDAQVHMINAAAGRPFRGVLAANISIGWSHRF
jgi:hypothetical protein